MSKLHLESLEIENFRAFKHLKIEKLGRVNLITGKNGVGKSCVLESLALFANNGRFATVVQALHARQEIGREFGSHSFAPEALEEVLSAARGLFNDWPDLLDNPRLRISEIGQDGVEAGVGWGLLRPNGPEADEHPDVDRPYWTASRLQQDPVPLDRTSSWRQGGLRARQLSEALVSKYVPAGGLSDSEMASIWDSIGVTEAGDHVLEAISVVLPAVTRLIFTEGTIPGQRVPQVRVAGAPPPTPLRLFGDGVVRMLGIALALASAGDGLLLIDEVENGLHYSVQEDLWRLIFTTARELNVQVFATTHSWDCVEGFQRAAVADKQEEGYLIRLQRKDDVFRVALYDEELLTTATREDIEVR